MTLEESIDNLSYVDLFLDIDAGVSFQPFVKYSFSITLIQTTKPFRINDLLADLIEITNTVNMFKDTDKQGYYNPS